MHIIGGIVGIILAYLLWFRYGEKSSHTVKHIKPLPYAPVGLNAMEVALIYKKCLNEEDIIPLILNLANQGYVKIMVAEEDYSYTLTWRSLKAIQWEKEKMVSKKWKLVWQKRYEGRKEAERIFLEGLFVKKRVLENTRCLRESFYTNLNKIGRKTKKESYRYIEKSSETARNCVLGMIGLLFF
ncbi:MAG: DUF2207 family protein, partial [Cellulosilyticaceae bacterium]